MRTASLLRGGLVSVNPLYLQGKCWRSTRKEVEVIARIRSSNRSNEWGCSSASHLQVHLAVMFEGYNPQQHESRILDMRARSRHPQEEVL
jgi:hypothetical protein